MRIKKEEVTMSPYMRAYQSGVKLAEHEWYTKLANPESGGVPEDFADRIDAVRDDIIARGGVPGSLGGVRELDGADVDVDYLNIPKYKDLEMAGPYENPQDAKPLREVRVPTSYYPRGMNRADAVAARDDESLAERGRMVESRDYVNPLILGHESAHRYGADEVEADAYAALGNYDMFDVADMYNQLSGGGELPAHREGDSHLSPQERMSLFAGMLPGGPSSRPVPEQAGPPELFDYERGIANNFIPEGSNSAPARASQGQAGPPELFDYERGIANNFIPEGSNSAPQEPGYFDRFGNFLADSYNQFMDNAGYIGSAIQSGYNSLADSFGGYFDGAEPPSSNSRVYNARNNVPTNIGGQDFYPNDNRGQTSTNPPPTLADRVNATRPSRPAGGQQSQPDFAALGRATFNGVSMPTSARQSAEVAGPPAPNRFSAVRGGYAAQLDALRNQAGLSQEDRDFLQRANYRQLAGAMGNRGLRVGDSFDANDLIQRMRMRQSASDQPGAMAGASMPQIAIQNRRGRDVTRGNISNYRPTQAPANVNPSNNNQFSPRTNPSLFKLPEMVQPSRSSNMAGGRLPMVGGR